MSATWVSVIIAAIAVVISLLALIFGRSDKGQATSNEHAKRIHQNELATERLRGDVAEKYATKHELREAVDDLKTSINGRFDRLEDKLDKERDAA
ncbi:hypothetical protein [Photobacterium ganghwense]|uniref:Uncharacterized protein n=1 Tax=Photobacterium ganghwense TaxID=320778 RepID=A0A0J1H8B1_9GAMM|nr:hypothetical protein [Photobacterium ganghwense]KLV07970.1 hypothetical protein ABT57_14065 [Photobacterium ganghwense]MBV1843355.1 hypothetical protein [Photobacterium ganghwense]PSU07075.1 hypothetical protein C9I92_15075 [Photobacterium ganghwense]QSV15830.1 hypothetical protein FH974_21495 [Photobacterium ganghwense]